jgi:GTPase SAR1 family protein
MDPISQFILTLLSAIIGTYLPLSSKIDNLKKSLDKREELLEELQSNIDSKEIELGQLRKIEKRYEQVINKLREGAGMVKDYYQPVILVGPRSVGKSSLLIQWSKPWSHLEPSATRAHTIDIVPILNFKKESFEPHYADPDVRVNVHIHLNLKVHDFPGELNGQKNVIDQAKEETLKLQNMGGSPGVVFICMFNAEEAVTGLCQPTIEYYNGDLFASLRNLVSCNNITLDKLILVFNKYDLLKNHYLQENDDFLVDKCREAFRPVILHLCNIVNPEKMCEIPTILLQGDGLFANSRGASIVKGEAARNFVRSIKGEHGNGF